MQNPHCKLQPVAAMYRYCCSTATRVYVSWDMRLTEICLVCFNAGGHLASLKKNAEVAAEDWSGRAEHPDSNA